MAVLIGQTGTGVNSANSNSAGIAFAVRLVCGASGTVDTLYLNVGTTVPSAANTHWAIYADSAGPVAGARLSADNSGTALVASTYSALPVSPGLHVNSGTFYWLAFLGTLAGGVGISYTDFATSGGNTQDSTGNQNTLADPYSGGSSFTNIFNARAEGTLDGDGVIKTFRAIPFQPFPMR